MTLRSLKKRQTTALTLTRGKRTSFTLLLAAVLSATAVADTPLQGLRPVPKTGSQVMPSAAASPTHQPQHDGWNLQWRKSPQLEAVSAPESVASSTNAVQPSPSQDEVFSQPPASLERVNPLQRVGHNVELSAVPVSRAAWARPQFGLPENAPIPAAEPNGFKVPVPQADDATDFFNNPFGDDTATNPLPPPRSSSPAASQPASPALPSDARPMNDLRNDLQRQFEAKPQPTSPGTPKPGSSNQLKPSPKPAPTDNGPSLREMLQRERPQQGRDETKSPSDREDLFQNPFPQRDAETQNSDERSREEAELPRQPFGNLEGEDLKRPAGLSCEDFRKRIADQSILDVSLDISPPFRPDVIAESEFQKLKRKFDEKQEIRQWRSIEGTPLASGRLIDLAYEKAVVKTEYGATEELSINRLSEADLAFIAQNWGLPTECLIEQVAYQPRTWTHTTMTWKASNLCHKPLYYEEVNLERYGHTAGPFLQPVISSAHFFANIAVMPYKMGIHPPSECQYALGYYRPGNCAPWIVPPVPLSLRGGLTQAAAMTGAFWLIP